MQGFSLLEIMFVMVLLTIASAISYPFFNYFQHQIARKKMLTELQYAVTFAKLSAVMQHTSIVVCPTIDGKQCTEDWQKGFMVATIAAGMVTHKVLKRYPRIQYGHLSWQGFPKRSYVLFSPVMTQFTQNGKFIYCPDKKLQQGAVILYLNRLNRVRIEVLDVAASKKWCDG